MLAMPDCSASAYTLIDQVAAFRQGAPVKVLYTPVSATVLAET
jgi:hypothetical protein